MNTHNGNPHRELSKGMEGLGSRFIQEKACHSPCRTSCIENKLSLSNKRASSKGEQSVETRELPKCRGSAVVPPLGGGGGAEGTNSGAQGRQ